LIIFLASLPAERWKAYKRDRREASFAAAALVSLFQRAFCTPSCIILLTRPCCDWWCEKRAG
jgi:hypothetical protein